MIPKQEILQIATDTNLSAQVIEKDYVLGWILAGINKHEAFARSWVFKGGTCLKKCYFETYRFSEDLDFTLNEASHLNINFLKDAFSTISEWVYDQSGIELPVDRMIFDCYKPGSCQGRVFYRGPVTPTSPQQMPRIKLDLTVQELVVESPVINLVNHRYSDLPRDGIHIQCYAYIEVFAEKIRALAERTRPRDLYDVINFFRRPESQNLATEVRRVLQKKCDFKDIPTPTYIHLKPHREACLAGWTDQLAHQLQALPPFESFWNELQKFFDWLEHPETIITHLENIPSPLHLTSVHDTIPLDIWRYGSGIPELGMLDRIRFAAANHLCVEILYAPENRPSNTYIIEPYSLRRSADGHLLIYALKHQTEDIRAFRTDRIIEAKATSQSFIPSYRIEFLPTNTSISLTSSAQTSLGTPKKARDMRIKSIGKKKSSGFFKGTKHVYQCQLCSKRFSKKRMSSTLNTHKNKHGYKCSGRIGVYIGTR